MTNQLVTARATARARAFFVNENHPKSIRLLLCCIAIAATSVFVVSPTASAHLATTSASCTNGTTTFAATISLPPANSFTPFLVSYAGTGASAGVLVPQTIVLNGETLISAIPGLDVSALSGQKTTCTFQSPRGTFDVTGILVPPSH